MSATDSHSRRGGRAPLGALVALCAMTLAGLAVRLTGIEFCLPHMRENDSEIVTQVAHLRGKPLKSKSSRVFYATYPMMTALATWAATSQCLCQVTETPPPWRLSCPRSPLSVAEGDESVSSRSKPPERAA